MTGLHPRRTLSVSFAFVGAFAFAFAFASASFTAGCQRNSLSAAFDAPEPAPAGTVEVLVPEGSVFAQESVHPVRWSLPGDPRTLDPTVAIVESTDAGATWRTVGYVGLREQYYRWTIPRAERGRVGVVFRILGDSTRPAKRAETSDIPFEPSQRRSYQWVQVTPNAAFGPRDGAGGIVHNGKMWLLGGWNGERFPRVTANDVWSSTDGAQWVLEKPNTFVDAATFGRNDWEGRHFAGYHSFNGKMWIVGGDPNQGYYQTDVWSSENGRDWTRTDKHTVTPRIDPNGNPYPLTDARPVEESTFGLRTAQITAAFSGRLWVMGGQRVEQFVNPEWPGAPAKAFDDVWTSVDGTTFEQVKTEGPLWSPRGYVSEAVEHDGRLWIVGGGLHDDPGAGRARRSYYSDVWSTKDGARWEVALNEPPFSPRIWHNVKAFDGRLWLINGYDGDVLGQGRLADNREDVWYSVDGKNWYDASPPAPFVGRHAGTAWVYNGALYVGSGNAIRGTWHADVWRLTPSGG